MTTTPNLWRSGFIDNQNTGGGQFEGVVATTPSNQFFAVWVDDTNFNGGVDTIVARSFNSFGDPLTVDIPLPLGTFIVNAGLPAAVRLPIAGQNDGLAVAFESHFSGTDTDLYLVRRDANLAQLGPPFTVIENSGLNTDHPSIASFSNGEVWVSYTAHFSGTNWDILAQRVNAAGATVGGPVTLWDAGDIRTDNSDLATLANGNFVAVFSREFGNNPADHDVFFAIRTEAGVSIVSPTPVNGANNTPGDEALPHVAALADGGFVVSWFDSVSTDNAPGIRAAVYDASGGLVQGNIIVNVFNTSGPPGFELPNDVTALPDGGFIVAWEDPTGGVDRAQRFDSAGNLNGTPIVFSDHATFNINAATYSDGRAIFTINDFFSGPNNNVVSSIWDTRATDANQVTGENFIGAGGGPADLFAIANHNGVRTAEVLPSGQVIAIVGSNVDFDGAGDFNHDGLSDLLAHKDAAGVRNFFAYQMTPVGPAGTTTVANVGTNWIADAFGDFNGDGTSDILLHRDTGGTRTLEVLSMNNYAVQSAPIVQVTGVDWVVDGTGDFNNSGTSDILEHRVVGGNVMNLQVVTLQNNVVQSVSLLANIGSDWQVDGTGDFNHDGTSDILIHRDSPGQVRTLEVLTIQNNAIQSATVIAQVGTNISVDGIGDFNGDGTSDIALHQDVGTTRTDRVYDVVNNVVVNPHTVAVTGIDWHVS
jgi:hypothetical protein